MTTGDYQKTTVADMIRNHINQDTYLPAIQREYVWNREQICKLFDSLMCGYPISSFLFWKIREEDKKKWITYEFIKDFDIKRPHNIEANLDGVNRDIYLVLDGQQRMTSIFVGLKGSYTYFYYRERKEYLFINLLHDTSITDSNPNELRYQFEFRENNSTKVPNEELWYRVGDILNYSRPRDAKNAIKDVISTYTDEQQSVIENNIEDLHNTIFTQQCLNYYEERSDNYDTVVEIFVRTNTGGVKLEYSDILLSTATARWGKLNAREEIHSFTDSLNLRGGQTYNFGKDFVMKGAMYLTDGLPIQYKISSFTKENLLKIEDNWENIKYALESALDLLASYGLTDKNIVSRLAILPIAQYILKRHTKNFVNSTEIAISKDRELIIKWFVFNLIRNSFGSSSDQKLRTCQSVLNEQDWKEFPYRELNREFESRPHLRG